MPEFDDHDPTFGDFTREPDYGGRGRGGRRGESSAYEGRGYGSDYDFEGAGGYENRGGFDEDPAASWAPYGAGGGPDRGPEYRDYDDLFGRRYGREQLDWSGLGNDERGRGNLVAPRGGDRAARFRGVGPRGWQRSDAAIHEHVCEALTDADVDVSEVSVDVTDGLVTLTGTVADPWTKRVVEDTAYLARGVREIRNRLELA